MATIDEILRVNHELTAGSLSALRSGPDLLGVGGVLVLGGEALEDSVPEESVK